MRLARYAFFLLAIGCGAAPPVVVETEPEPEPVAEAAPIEEAPPAPEAPVCTVAVATGPVPDLLLEAELPAPPPARARRGRRVIQLTEMDGYGPLHVFSADREGQLTDLGLGSDPRLLDDGSIAFLEHDWDRHTASFVRITRDGSITRTPGGNGRAGSLGGPAPRRMSPFTRDGRFMAWLTEGCFEGGEACRVDLFDSYPTSEEAPIDRVPVEPHPARRLALSEDGLRIGVCSDAVPSASVFDRTTRAWTTVPIEGRCVAFAPDLSSVLVVPADEGRTGLARVSFPSGARQEVATSMALGSIAYDPCGASAVMTGLIGEMAQRAERVFFDGRAPETLVEAPMEPHVFADVEIDRRGWVLLSSEDGMETLGVWIVPLTGGEAHHATIDHGARIFGVTLGPDVAPRAD